MSTMPSPQYGPYLHVVVQPPYEPSLIFPPQLASEDMFADDSPQSHSSAPVCLPSPQRGMQTDFSVANPLSVSW
jgi:hypothetical protein